MYACEIEMTPLSILLAAAPVSGLAACRRDTPLDLGWRFFRGDAAPSCTSTDFPVRIGRCEGLHRNKVAAGPSECRNACCAEGPSCETWQWCSKDAAECEGVVDQCWLGAATQCASSNEGWVTEGRTSSSPPAPLPLFALSAFDDSTWRSVEVPHDWSVEDLPAREDDTVTPAVTVRNSTWKFSEGDDARWSASDFDDSAWRSVEVPHDWNRSQINATGWYRRHFALTAAQLDAYAHAIAPARLALGEVACSDTTFVNGEQVGSTNNSCLEFRAYELSHSALKANNVVAVRVVSESQNSPGGLCDAGALALNGVSVASGGDWQPPSPFDPARTGAIGRSYGYAVGGTGWYRQTFNYSCADAFGERVRVRFDGVYMNADVFLNDVHLGVHPYGYTAFEFDLTALIKPGPNVLAVRVRNLGSNSRWYSGSGIFRHVHLIATPAVHVRQWGVATSSSVSADYSSANVTVSVICVNDGTASVSSVDVSATVIDASGNVVGIAKGRAMGLLGNGGTAKATLVAVVANPVLWELDAPHLYSTSVELTSGDAVATAFGIRTVEVSASSGFLLNGKSVELRGGCVHHDNGPLGAAAITRAEERRVESLKALGYNAIRTSHNPVSPAFLDACDRLGVMVMHEAFDCWEQGKNSEDYHARNELATHVLATHYNRRPPRSEKHQVLTFPPYGAELRRYTSTTGGGEMSGPW